MGGSQTHRSLDAQGGGPPDVQHRAGLAVHSGIWLAATVTVLAAAMALDIAIVGAPTDSDHARLVTWTCVAGAAAIVVGIGQLTVRVARDARLRSSPSVEMRRSLAVSVSAVAVGFAAVRGVAQGAGLVDHLRAQVDEPLTVAEFILRIAVTVSASGLVVWCAWRARGPRARS